MADIFGLDVPLPTMGVGSGKIVIIMSILLTAIAGCIIVYVIYQYRIYNKKIIVFENIAGQGFQPVLKDRARLIKLGSGGEEIMWLKKKAVYRTAYGKKMGKNTYWFVIGQDGYWYNSLLGDLDAKMGMLDIEPVDRDMRYMHVAIRKNIQESYRKQNFMDKYGTIIISGFFMLVMIIGIWFLLDRMAEISSGLSSAVGTSVELQESNRGIAESLNKLINAGGLVKA